MIPKSDKPPKVPYDLVKAQMAGMIRPPKQEGKRVRASLRLKFKTLQWIYKGDAESDVVVADCMREIIKGASRLDIESALRVLRREEKQRCKRKLKRYAQSLCVDNDGDAEDDEIRKFVRSVVGPVCDAKKFEVYVWRVKRWLWQVVRKCMGLSTENELMLILWSRTGKTGKSDACKILFEPFKELMRKERIHSLLNQFQCNLLSRSYIVWMEEFRGPGCKSKLDALKDVITGDTFDGRTPHSDGGVDGVNVCSLIGTCNEPPPFGVNDNGGGRRYGDIPNCEKPIQQDKPRGDLARSVDWRKLYKGINWTIPNMYMAMPDDVRQLCDAMQQETATEKDVWRDWFNDYTVEAKNEQMHTNEVKACIVELLKLPIGYETPARFSRRAVADELKRVGGRVETQNGHYYLMGRRARTLGDMQRLVPQDKEQRM